MRKVRKAVLIVAPLALTGLIVAGCSSSPQSSTSSAPSGMSMSHSMTDHAPSSASPDSAANSSQPQLLKSANGKLDVTLTAAESQVPYQGTTRWAMTYNGSATGPTLSVRPGDTLNVTLVNNLDKPTSLHTHGLHVSPTEDDPFVMVDPGASRTFTYHIPADQQAGTFWYHPHVHSLTAEQVASGLSGAIVVENATDDALAAVSTNDVLVVNDPPLSQTNPWASTGNGGGSMDMGGMDMGSHSGGMDMGSGGVTMQMQMMGRTGPRILTNGADGVALAASQGKLQRVHIVNATASTRMNFTFTGKEMMRLASEGGYLSAPESVQSVELAPGERTELILVPGSDGGKLMAQRLSNEGDGGLMGVPELVASVDAAASSDTSMIPAPLNSSVRDLFASDVQVAQQRVITLDGHMNPTIDGKPFDPNTVNFTAKKGTVEEWVIKSNSPMVHPIHLHTWPFQVRGEQGWQDVVTVPANGEKVIRVAFDDFAGTTVLHCHVLDHEDTGMMAIIKVE